MAAHTSGMTGYSASSIVTWQSSTASSYADDAVQVWV